MNQSTVSRRRFLQTVAAAAAAAPFVSPPTRAFAGPTVRHASIGSSGQALSDLMAPLGSESDISLVNGDFYAAAIREQLTVESSIHYKFKNDLTAYRFKARGGGIPIPLAPYAYKSDGTNLIAAHSPFVTLDDVVAS